MYQREKIPNSGNRYFWLVRCPFSKGNIIILGIDVRQIGNLIKLIVRGTYTPYIASLENWQWTSQTYIFPLMLIPKSALTSNGNIHFTSTDLKSHMSFGHLFAFVVVQIEFILQTIGGNGPKLVVIA